VLLRGKPKETRAKAEEYIAPRCQEIDAYHYERTVRMNEFKAKLIDRLADFLS
jgi:hypothetical protein